MKNLNITLFVIISLFTSPVFSQSVELTFKPKKGSQYLEMLRLNQEINTEMLSTGLEQQMINNVAVFANSEILERNHKGHILLKQKFTRMTMDMDLMGAKSKVDTDNEGELSDMEAEVLKELKPLIYKELISEIANDGTVLGYEADEDLKETFDMFTSSINNSSYGVLPNKKVNINDTWDFVSEADSSNGLIMLINFKYQLKKIEGNHAIVDISGTITQKKESEKDKNEDQQSQEITLKNSKLQGTGIIDIESGIYLDMELNMNMNLLIKVNDAETSTTINQRIIRIVSEI